MGGWKTWVAAIGMILTGLGLIIAGMVSDPIEGDKIKQGLTLLFAGLGMIGLGHKIEKAAK